MNNITTNEIHKTWLELLYRQAISDAYIDMENERMRAIGYSGSEPNPHVQNIKSLVEYINLLNDKIAELGE